MFRPTTYTNRRNQLKKQFNSGILLFPGNMDSPMNYKDNIYHFRQDSTFLYFFGIDQPGLITVMDIDQDECILFGNELTVDDIVWLGQHASIKELASKVGITDTRPTKELQGYLKKASSSSKPIHYLPPYRAEKKIRLHQWLEIPVNEVDGKASMTLTKAVIGLRSIKTAEEIVEMEKAVNTTAEMHLLSMKNAKPGILESELTGMVHGKAISDGGDLAYPIILTVNGQTLHNHYHGNVLKSGQLLLGDFGAATSMHYAGDITRTFPVDPVFTNRQKEIYEIVLKSEVESIASLKPGITYRSVHLEAARIIAEGLRDLGLMKGDMNAAVAAGAHALFFPHGLGHMIGLDVHDMEDLGEDLVGYDETVKRSDQFGLAYLRLGRELKNGFVITVEPGIYFIPELIDQWKAEGKFKDFLNYDKIESYKDFGGIRIEDNVLINESGHQILGNPIPKSVEEVESVRQSDIG